MINNPGSYRETKYLFIDGGYVAKAYSGALDAVFREHGELDLSSIATAAGARRSYYYDCLHDLQGKLETDEAFERRKESQRSAFDNIERVNGFRVRLGSLTGKARRARQKKVDILLTVDMLDHAFRRNMDQVYLFAGDADFVPLLEAVARLGTYVHLWYEKKSGSLELRAAADVSREINFLEWYGWTDQKFKESHPIPSCVYGSPSPGSRFNGPALMKRGNCGDRQVELWNAAVKYVMYAPAAEGRASVEATFANLDTLECFFSVQFGELTWE